jgi:enolase
MRLNAEGSYFTPNDTLNDTIKILEEIIKDTGESSKLSLGIDCNSNNYFNDVTKKYDMDGFKQPPDADALIDYYLKYLSEHPLISFLEDPLADGDIQGWKKIFSKFESKPNVVISSKSLIDERVNKLRHLTQLADLEQAADYMTEEEKQKIQGQNKVRQEENENKVHFSNVSFRVNDCVNLSELFESYQFIQNKLSTSEKKVGFNVWDNAVESDQSSVVDIALGLRAKMVILHGFNNRNERINKVNRYIDLIEELY